MLIHCFLSQGMALENGLGPWGMYFLTPPSFSAVYGYMVFIKLFKLIALRQYICQQKFQGGTTLHNIGKGLTKRSLTKAHIGQSLRV